jgi:hypothetical protein
MTAWASRADVVAHPQEGEELESNILHLGDNDPRPQTAVESARRANTLG